MAEGIHYGDELRLRASFYDADGDLEDPTTVTFKLKKPSGAETEYVFGVDAEVIRAGRGLYRMDFIVDESRNDVDWFCRIEGTGIVTGVDELSFQVKDTAFS